MDAPVLVAVISAAAGIFASALTFYLTKKKEHEAEWRKQKLESYKELLSAMNGIVGDAPSLDAKAQFAHTANHILLVAAPPVLVAMRAFLDEISVSNLSKSAERHDVLLTALMYAIRDDLGIAPNRASDEFQFRLWASDKKVATKSAHRR